MKMNVVVSRRKWARGAKTDGTALRVFEVGPHHKADKGKMCCLGFACKQLGVRTKVLNDVSMPSELFDEAACSSVLPTEAEKALVIASPLVRRRKGRNPKDSRLAMHAQQFNDDEDLDEKTREQSLTRLFRKAGHSMVFVP